MPGVSKFIESELDRVNDYLGMAKANLVVASELCEERCKRITSTLNPVDEKVIDYLNKELYKLDVKIADARAMISQFKSYYFDLESKAEEEYFE